MARPDILSLLLRRADITAPDLLAADVAAVLQEAGGRHLVLYVVDYEQHVLQPVALASDLLPEAPPGVPITGTEAGRSFQDQAVVLAPDRGGWTVWAPLVERSERLGVLEAGFEDVDDDVLQLCEDLGKLVGHLLHTARRYTDVIELRRRRQRMNLAAEMQWDMLLPPLTFCAPAVAVAGLLEPAYNVGGDAFDYSLNGELLGFAVFDSMGHGLRSALASTLALAAFKYGRRRGLALTEIVKSIDEALIAEFDGEVFVTGHVLRLDTETGEVSWINAGHPDPLLIRNGKVIAEPHAEPCLPLGLGAKITEVGALQLEAGDRLLFYSDGVIEARTLAGEQFELDRLRAAVERYLGAGVVPAEVLRRTVADVRDHSRQELQDDATLVMIEWQPDLLPLGPVRAGRA